MSVYVCACHLNLVSLVAFSLVNLSNEKFPRKTGTKRGYNSRIKNVFSGSRIMAFGYLKNCEPSK